MVPPDIDRRPLVIKKYPQATTITATTRYITRLDIVLSEGLSPLGLPYTLSRAASSARSVRVAHSLSLARVADICSSRLNRSTIVIDSPGR